MIDMIGIVVGIIILNSFLFIFNNCNDIIFVILGVFGILMIKFNNFLVFNNIFIFEGVVVNFFYMNL